jgi:cobalt-zinc-cadmium efflux system protein
MRTYGYQRFEVLAAFVNGLALIALVGWILVEAVGRLRQPVDVADRVLIAIASVGLVANIGCYLLLHGGDRRSLNIEGALIHVVGDLFGSVAAISAGVVIALTGWMPIDPILSIVVALLILRSGVGIVRRSAHVLLEGTPRGLDLREVSSGLAEAVPGIANIHHIHAWSLNAEESLITLHASLRGDEEPAAALQAMKAHLASRHGITHSVVQLETEACPDSPAGADCSLRVVPLPLVEKKH